MLYIDNKLLTEDEVAQFSDETKARINVFLKLRNE